MVVIVAGAAVAREDMGAVVKLAGVLVAVVHVMVAVLTSLDSAATIEVT